MRKQWTCSKCGFACSLACQSLKPSKQLILCNSCRSKEAEKRAVLDPKSAKKVVSFQEARIKKPLITQISTNPSTSVGNGNENESVAISVRQVGMIFGNLTFEPTLAIPFVNRKPVERKVKTEVVTEDQDEFYRGKTFKPSTTLGINPNIQIKQEYDCDAVEEKEEAIWDSKKVKKRKRSKLPQYTLSPLARFINCLRQASCLLHHRRRHLVRRPKPHHGPKYDDVLIYEKCCLYVAENEIGLGAELLSPPVLYDSRKIKSSSTSLVMMMDQ